MDGRILDLSESLAIRASGKHLQPFRDEFLAEVCSIARRMDVDLDRIKVAVVPMAQCPEPASTGTRCVRVCTCPALPCRGTILGVQPRHSAPVACGCLSLHDDLMAVARLSITNAVLCCVARLSI